MSDTILLHTQVAVVCAAALLYGLYTSTLFYCYRWLIFTDEGWKCRNHISWPLVIVSTLIFLMTGAYVSIMLASTMRKVYIFTYLPPGNTPIPVIPWFAIAECSMANLTVLLADSVLMYRLWVVYASFRILIFPLILWVGGMVCTALQVYLQIAHISNPFIGPDRWSNVQVSLGPGIVLTPFWGSTAVLNIYCTSLLVYKIYTVSKGNERGPSTQQFRFVIRILAESGFLYLATTIIHFVAWFTSDDVAITVVSSFTLPLIGIAFNLILIRTGRNRANQIHPPISKQSSFPESTLQFAPSNTHSLATDFEVDPSDHTLTSRHDLEGQC